MKVPSERSKARRRNEMGVGKGAELWLKRNWPHLKIMHVWNRLFHHSEIKRFAVATEQSLA